VRLKSPRSSAVEALPSFHMQAAAGMEVLTESKTRPAIPCLRCGECCRHYQVRLDLPEAERIAGEQGLALDVFRRGMRIPGGRARRASWFARRMAVALSWVTLAKAVMRSVPYTPSSLRAAASGRLGSIGVSAKLG